MAKKRVHEIAKEKGIPSKEVIAVLQKAGLNVKAAASSVDEADIARAFSDGSGPPAEPAAPPHPSRRPRGARAPLRVPRAARRVPRSPRATATAPRQPGDSSAAAGAGGGPPAALAEARPEAVAAEDAGAAW